MNPIEFRLGEMAKTMMTVWRSHRWRGYRRLTMFGTQIYQENSTGMDASQQNKCHRPWSLRWIDIINCLFMLFPLTQIGSTCQHIHSWTRFPTAKTLTSNAMDSTTASMHPLSTRARYVRESNHFEPSRVEHALTITYVFRFMLAGSCIIIVSMAFDTISCAPILQHSIKSRLFVISYPRWIARHRPNIGSGTVSAMDDACA